ncbi:Dimethylaniline monooxygenase [N-oxide-forming] 5 [Araneus ventricosus]|uniref:Flavin-containing monooxygenase n=1 Tax=Araneus ventricosus TaxID=182803 RepID=A0A4Y2QMF7_ARAVE|nr:Dimethylaniline monooxygenase [N-oxide-forming] 5 [Araneus ventricosus]
MIRNRYAVIGAGPTGIAAIKCLKEEGMVPVCFERTSHIGGLWRYHDDDINGLASVMKSTVINNSKEMGAMSDFPPKEEYPNFMHNKHVFDYITSYEKAFDIERYIQVNREIIEVGMADDYETTGRLYVVVKDTKTGAESREVFDGVFVCVGHHVFPNWPSFPGMEKFKGKVLHTHSLKKVDPFEDQVVVVVGVGNSGMDAAVEISSVAKQVYLSTRRGVWVVPRVGPWGLPIDIQMQRRWLDVLFKISPYSLVCWFCELAVNLRFDHSLYSLKPKHRIWSQHATVSDSLPIKLLSGAVVVRKNIAEFVENGVIFDEEEKVTECDSVVFATGYKIKFPFLDERLTVVKNNEVHLYKYIFPPHLKHPTLVICGLVQTVGAGFPTFEAQARLATLVMNGKVRLPSREEMEADIRKRKEVNSKRYSQSERHTIQADYIPYLDEIYSLIGAKPNFLKIFCKDPVLFWTLYFGPSLPYQYRLQGPHAWSGARQAILDWRKRMEKPLRNGYDAQQDSIKV